MTELRGVGRASRSRAAALLLVVLGVLVGGCQTISSPGSVAGAPTAPAASAPRPAADTPVAATAAQDTVVLASRGDSISLNPLLNIDNASRNVWQNIFEPLVKPDPLTGAPAPALADRFDQSADGRTYTFSIRPNVLWSDGQPLTADDAKFTFDAALDPRTNSPWRTRLGLVERVESPDAQTFRVVLKSPLCPFLIDGMGLPILPKHVLAGSADLSTDAFNFSRPVGTGAYIFNEWARDDHLTLTANPKYWGGAPKIGQWVRKIFPDSNIVAIKMKAGEVDYGAVAPSSIDEMKTQSNLGVLSYPGTNVNYVIYNLDRPIFQDRDVRQALTYALDRQSIVDSILLGEGGVQDSPILKQSWAYNQNVPVFAYNPDTARKLLADAGWAPGSDGILQKAGTPFQFTLLTDAATPQRTSFQVIAQDQWRKVGIQAQVQQLTFAAVTDKLKAHDFDAVVLGANLAIDPDQTATWSSKAYPGGENYAHYANTTVDGLLEQGRAVQGCDQAVRKPIYDAIQQQIAQDQPYTFLWGQQTSVVYNKRLQNLAPNYWADAAGVAYDGIQKWIIAR
jgi:peptide/nickel transport system substrate-binding protein